MIDDDDDDDDDDIDVTVSLRRCRAGRQKSLLFISLSCTAV